ncbi:MAG: HupE/UreJ family protein [Gemmatimonadota bacterium]|nr:HupE/UreJ family protein [Gemmatimonadota bacterium]
MNRTIPHRNPLRAICAGLLLIFGAGVVAAPDAGARPPTPAVDLLPHDIPRDVTVQAFVRPAGDRLTFLVRVPLEAMRDIEFPTIGPGYLDIEAAEPDLREAAITWLQSYVTFYEDGRALDAPELLRTRITLPSNRSFATFERAEAHLRAPGPPAGTLIPWQQALLDVEFAYHIGSDESDFAIRSELAHLGIQTLTVLRFLPPDSGERVFQFTGDPGRVELDPSWLNAAWRFVVLGFEHILDGIDHLLFLACLVIPIRSVRALVPVITAFTVAHSITLIASASGIAPGGLWFPPLIETLIALSIVYMAIENIVGARPDRRWMLAFGFGLVHGFGFSFVLRETLQFAGSHLLASLLAFNIGVELGQLAVVAVAVPALAFVLARVASERMVVIVLSVLIAHTAWHWMTERGAEFLQYDIAIPALDAAFAATLMRWAILLLVVGGAAWALRRPFGRWMEKTDPATPGSAAAPPGT